MPIIPIITFKAGCCATDTSQTPMRVKPDLRKGYVYLYSEDELIKFCWRERDKPLDEPEIDLVMIPQDGVFVPYGHDAGTSSSSSSSRPGPTVKPNGRVFVLKFASSPERHFFWMQSKPQSRTGDPGWFSPRDLKIGEIVSRLLQGEEVDVLREMRGFQNRNGPQGDQDGDQSMEDAEPDTTQDPPAGGAGGAGPDATGGDVREEGESSREGGADGARAASSQNIDAASAVRNFLDSLKGNPGLSSSRQQDASDKPYPHLTHLLHTSTTVPMVEAATEEFLDELLGNLPPTVLVLASGSADLDSLNEPTQEAADAARASLSVPEKRALLKRVFHSPQFAQALAVLTMALRDGGLPDVAGALRVNVENGGRIPGGMPMGGGAAVEAFVEGIKKGVEDKQ